MRTVARETLFKIIFAAQFNESIDTKLENALIKTDKLDDNDAAYLNEIIAIINEHGRALTDTIDAHSRLFPESGLFPADKSVLLIALAEILYYKKVPNAVSVNEAANIVSKYSTEKSASFISGILSEIIREQNNG